MCKRVEVKREERDKGEQIQRVSRDGEEKIEETGRDMKKRTKGKEEKKQRMKKMSDILRWRWQQSRVVARKMCWLDPRSSFGILSIEVPLTLRNPCPVHDFPTVVTVHSDGSLNKIHVHKPLSNEDSRAQKRNESHRHARN